MADLDILAVEQPDGIRSAGPDGRRTRAIGSDCYERGRRAGMGDQHVAIETFSSLEQNAVARTELNLVDTVNGFPRLVRRRALVRVVTLLPP